MFLCTDLAKNVDYICFLNSHSYNTNIVFMSTVFKYSGVFCILIWLVLLTMLVVYQIVLHWDMVLVMV